MERESERGEPADQHILMCCLFHYIHYISSRHIYYTICNYGHASEANKENVRLREGPSHKKRGVTQNPNPAASMSAVAADT